MVIQLIEAFLHVYKWKVVKQDIVSTPQSISNNEKIQMEVKGLPEEDPLVYSMSSRNPTFEDLFDFWCEDNMVDAGSVEMARGDFWNDENEKASPERELAIKVQDEEVAKHTENQG